MLNVSAVGSPRMPKSWCSRWLPVVPLFSEEARPQQPAESAGVRHIAPTAPTPSAAPIPYAAPTSAVVPELTDLPLGGVRASLPPLVAGNVPPSSLQPAEGPSGPSPAPHRSDRAAPPLEQEAPPSPEPVPPAPASLAGKAAPWRKLVPQLLRQTYQRRATAGIAPVPTTLALPVPIATVPTPACIPLGVRNATAAALDERWANHWKAKKARATGPAPGTAAAPAILTDNPCWPFATSVDVALVAPSAPAAYCANPAAPTSVRIRSASGVGQQTMLTEVLDEMAEEEAFQELLEYALTSSPEG